MTTLVDAGPSSLAPDDITGPSARVLADSVCATTGVRLTSFETTCHRFVLAENNTHKVVAKSASSSRAIPFPRFLDRMRRNPALPVVWASEQKGMQGGAALDAEHETIAKHKWLLAMRKQMEFAVELHEIGVHKSLVNRLLEPWTWVRLVQTATAWDNMLDLRDHPDAQPELAAMAHAMRIARDASTPVPLGPGEFHLPYITPHDRDVVAHGFANGADLYTGVAPDVQRVLARISAGRCARTSYLTFQVDRPDGKVEESRIDHVADLRLAGTLLASQPRHYSPFEHQATPWLENRQGEPVPFLIGPVEHRVPTAHLPRVGNLLGWRHQRTEIEALAGDVTFR